MARKKPDPEVETKLHPEGVAGLPGPVVEATVTPPPTPWRQMKHNKMFPEEIRWLIRGYVAARGEKLPPCPVCGKKTRGRWTMQCPFDAHSLGQFAVVLTEKGTGLAPLTLVCNDHPLSPTKPIQEALL